MSSISSKKAAFHNLGCKVNSYETDMMIRDLKEAGVAIVSFDEKADIYIVNTCSVTNIADRKSRQMLHRARSLAPQAVIVAVGCYVQGRDTEQVLSDGVDIALGNNEKSGLVGVLEEYFENREKESRDSVQGKLGRSGNIAEVKEYGCAGILTETGGHTRAYIKIEDGCNQFCSYCIIPYVRGRVRSRGRDEIVSEVRGLTERGCREIVLTGINLSAYGTDLKADPEAGDLTGLISELCRIESLKRIRLSSIEPRILTADFINAMADLPKVCPHFHLSLQSGCDNTLKRMNRKYTAAEFYEAVCALREAFFNKRGAYPALTTDIIVGFPGETGEDFEECRAFLEKVRFFETHVFKYSSRKGTAAAGYPDQLTERVKSERSRVLLELNQVNRAAFIEELADLEDYTAELLVEEKMVVSGREYWFGHTGEYIAAVAESDTDLTGEIIRGHISTEKLLTDARADNRPVVTFNCYNSGLAGAEL